MNLSIAPINRLKPYFKIAESIALTSPCVRGQFGSVIAQDSPDIRFVAEANSRIARCCDGDICARNRFEAPHVQRIEIGAEVHSEIAALIRWGEYTPKTFFMLVGFAGGKQIYGRDSWPCHACALALKYAGFRHIYVKTDSHTISSVSISRVIEEREQEWQIETN